MKTTKIRSTTKLIGLIKKQPVYFYDGFYDFVVRTEPVKDSIDMYIKYKGKGEFKTGLGNTNAHDAIYLDSNTISKEDYDMY